MIHDCANFEVGSSSSRSKVLKFDVIIDVEKKKATLAASSSAQFRQVAALALYVASGWLQMNIEMNTL
jgi:hypothetical protein